MKKIGVLFVCVFLLSLGVFSNANAMNFTINDYSISANYSGDGLLILTEDVLPETYNFDLNVGDTTTVTLFNIWTSEGAVDADDTALEPISVNLDFTAPDNFAVGIDGNTYGVAPLTGHVDWSGTTEVNYGYINDIVW